MSAIYRGGPERLRFPITFAESLGASPGASATQNTAAIQAALAARGEVMIGRAGTYAINDTLIINGNTRLVCGPGVVLKQADGVNKVLLKNAAIDQTPATVTIAWTAGVLAAVTWTAHGLAAGDAVVFQGANQLIYNMPHRVHEVLTANTFTIRCAESPGASGTGTISGYICDRNIQVEGVDLDYNYANNSSAPQGPNRNASYFAFVADSEFEVKARNVYKFGFTLCAAMDCHVKNTGGVNCSDLAKFYGPLLRCSARNIFGVSRDDGMSVQAREPSAFAAYQVAVGHIFGLEISGVSVTSQDTASGGVVLYASDSETMERVSVSHVSAFAENGGGVVIKYGDTFTTGNLRSVRLSDINCATNTATTKYALVVSCDVEQLTLEDINPKNQDLTTATSLVRIENTAAIKNLLIRNLRFVNSAWPDTTAQYLVNINGDVETVIFDGGYVSVNSVSGRFLTVGANLVRNIIFRGFVMDTGGMFAIFQAGASNVRRVLMEGCRIKSVTSGFDVRSLTKFVLNGNDFDTMSSGVIRPTTTAGLMAQIYGAGNTFTSASPVSAANSATFEVYSYDIAIDPATATNIATTVGQFCTSTQAGNEGGPCVRGNANGTPGWYALAGAASGANQVIT